VNASPDPGGFDLVLPPLSTGGCLGLPRPRSAPPCHRPATRPRIVASTSYVVSQLIVTPGVAPLTGYRPRPYPTPSRHL